MTIQIYQGDCLDVMRSLPSVSVDLVLCDLPYGTTACKWDCAINLPSLWLQYRRLTKENAPQVLTASQPFTTRLIASNYTDFRYCWVWDKVNRYTGTLNANRMPLKRHEDIAVFYRSLPVYNKQYREGVKYKTSKGGHGAYTHCNEQQKRVSENDGHHHNPCSVLEISGDNKKESGLHPTQKPIALMEYLIKTYTNEGDTVLDNCMGSGTTGAACVNTGRNFIGIEKDLTYFEICKRRILGAEVMTVTPQAPSETCLSHNQENCVRCSIV